MAALTGRGGIGVIPKTIRMSEGNVKPAGLSSREIRPPEVSLVSIQDLLPLGQLWCSFFTRNPLFLSVVGFLLSAPRALDQG